MDESKIRKTIIEVLREVYINAIIDIDILAHVDLIDDLGMDSISFITIVVRIENVFDIKIPDEMLLMEKFRNIDNIVEIISNELICSIDENERDND